MTLNELPPDELVAFELAPMKIVRWAQHVYQQLPALEVDCVASKHLHLPLEAEPQC